MNLQNAPDAQQVRFWRDPNLAFLEVRYSRYKTISFPKHTHDTLSIGVVEQGHSSFFYRGKMNSIGPGEIAVIQPGEVHACNPQADTGWTYRMFHIDPLWLQRVADEATTQRRDLPNFSLPIIQNDTFFHALTNLHSLVESPTGNLEKESYIYTTFSQLITHYSDRDHPAPSAGEPFMIPSLLLPRLSKGREKPF